MRTKSFTPLFNTPHFLEKLAKNGGVDSTFHNRILEMVLYPMRAVSIVERIGDMVQIITKDYPVQNSLYTFACYLEEGEEKAKEALPSKDEIIKRLRNFPKIPYLLGGNTPYPLNIELPLLASPFAERNKRVFGVDCSGLLYFATGGNIPRNTSDYRRYSKEVSSLEPLDLIYFPGHVIIYLGEGECIESREFDGVTLSLWEEREKTIQKEYQFLRML